MLHELHSELTERGIVLRIVGAHGRVRDLLRAGWYGRRSRGVDRAVRSMLYSVGTAGKKLKHSPFVDEHHRKG